QTASQLKGTNIFAVLTLPVDKRKAAAVIDGAVADATSRRPAPSQNRAPAFERPAPITVEAAPADTSSYSSSGSGDGSSKKMMMIGGAIAAVVVAGAAAWFFTRSPAAPVAGTPEKKASVSITASKDNVSDDNVVAEPAPVVDMPLVNGTIDELLEKARL